MVIKSLEDIWNLFGELRKLKKYAPEITSAFQYFDQSEDPKKALGEIIDSAKRNPVLDDLLKISKTYYMVSRAEKKAEKKGWNYAGKEAVKEMGVNYEIRGAENIPTNGKALYISNHPYGLLDGAILLGGLGSLLSKEGRRLKLVGMNQLRFIKGIEKVVYFVHSTVKRRNLGSIRESLRYLDKGGNLAIYPSGGMSKAGLREYPWKSGLGIFVSHSSYVVPMWFSGPDHAMMYNFLSKIKIKKIEKLRRVLSLREVWNKVGQTIVLNIGKPISSEELKERGNIEERVQYLRQKAESLKVAV